jgi:putative peptide zinc metalloprotease protein
VPELKESSLEESSLEELIAKGAISAPDKARRRFRLGYPAWFVLGDLRTKKNPGVLSRVLSHRAVAPPRLAPGTELIGEYENSGFKEPVYLMRRADGQVIQSSRLLYLVAAEAEGQKDFEQIASLVSAKFGRTVSADNVRFLVEEKLRPLGVLAGPDGANTKLKRAAPALALKFRVPILPERVVQSLTVVFWPLFFTPVVVAALVGLLALDFWLFFVHGLAQSITATLHQPGLLLAGYVIAFLSGVLHECGHATACRYSGAKPGVIGMGIYLVYPVFYNDVTDSYRLGRGGRLRTDLGGVYLNVVFSLAMAGAYFLTGFEPLLLVVFVEQLIILEQFMPFLRLDGYYVVSDLTGVPDLFARIKPTLKSLIPGRGMDERVTELKPWVRVVVAAWVITTIPALLLLLGMLVANTPFIIATTWDSFLALYDEGWNALRGGRVVDGVGALLQIVLLIIPVVGMTLLYWMIGKKLGKAVWNKAKEKPALRPGLAVAAMVAAGVAFLVWRPSDDGQPVQLVEPAVSRGVPQVVHEGSAPEEPVTTTKPTAAMSTPNEPEEATSEPITQASLLPIADELAVADGPTIAEEPILDDEPTIAEEPALAAVPIVAVPATAPGETGTGKEKGDDKKSDDKKSDDKKGDDKKGDDKKGNERGARSVDNPCIGPDGREPSFCKNTKRKR